MPHCDQGEGDTIFAGGGEEKATARTEIWSGNPRSSAFITGPHQVPDADTVSTATSCSRTNSEQTPAWTITCRGETTSLGPDNYLVPAPSTAIPSPGVLVSGLMF